MPVTLTGRAAERSGAVSVEDAEPLAQWLRAHPQGRVSLRRCTGVHTAVLQVLLALEARVVGVPADPFLAAHVLPLLTPAGRTATGSAPSTAAPAHRSDDAPGPADPLDQEDD